MVGSKAARHVRPGGQLVYATCTFRSEENGAVVEAFLAQHPVFARTAEEQRLWPHVNATHGFTIACLRRVG